MNSTCRSNAPSQIANASRRRRGGFRLDQRHARMIEAIVAAVVSMTPLAVTLVLSVKQVVAA